MPSPLQNRRVFTAAPHRMLFFGGACQILLVMGWWLLELLARGTGSTGQTTVIPATWAHVFLMLFGIFPFFIFGFLLTVYPRWMNGPVVPTRLYVGIFWLLAAGMLGFYPGLYLSKEVLALALAIELCGWGLALYALYSVFRRAHQHGAHEKILNLALFAGALGVAGYLYGVITGNAVAFLLAREAGLWLFLVPVVFLVSHRMLPFFSSSVLVNYAVKRPEWILPLMLACVSGHAVLEYAGWSEWLFLFDLPLAAAALYLSWLWQLPRSFQVRLLAVLHIAFLWLGIAMLLYGLQSLMLFITGNLVLGRAPLHALGIGFLASMVLAMASRVSLGHSGRPLVADNLTWYCFLGLGLATLLRMASELPFEGPATRQMLNIGAATVWLACTGLWVWRYTPFYLRPRKDGKEG